MEKSSQQPESMRLVLSKNDLQRLWHVPKKYWSQGFKTLEGLDDKIAIAKQAVDVGESIFLTGVCGSGKTLLAICAMRYWWANQEDKQIYPTFVNVYDLLNRIKQSWSDNVRDQGLVEAEIVEYYRTMPFVVFDDIGVGLWGNWASGVMYGIINKRSEEEMQTIVTSNLDPDALAQIIDDRVVSRLSGMGIMLTLGKKDWRVNN